MHIFKDHHRYFILILSLFCLASISSNVNTFNFAIICLDPNSNSSGNSTVGYFQQTVSNINQERHRLFFPVGIFHSTTIYVNVVSWSWVDARHVPVQLEVVLRLHILYSFSYSRFGARWVFWTAGILSGTLSSVKYLLLLF